MGTEGRGERELSLRGGGHGEDFGGYGVEDVSPCERLEDITMPFFLLGHEQRYLQCLRKSLEI